MIKNPYDQTSVTDQYGHWNLDENASYTLTNPNGLKGPWYYIYQNKRILLYVDQNGPVKIQYQPPSGILVLKREWGETDSRWQVFIESSELNDGIPVSNFGSPKFNCKMKQPKTTVKWNATTATYTYEYDHADIITELFVPFDKATVCMKTTIKNKSAKAMDFSVTPAIFPYVNVPQMIAWDLPEWHLATTSHLESDKMMTFHGKMSSSDMIKGNERSVTYNIDFDIDGEFEIDMSKFAGSNSFFAPEAVLDHLPLSYKMREAKGNKSIAGQRSVWASKYSVTIASGESKTFTQVLTVQDAYDYDLEENLYDECYFDDYDYSRCVIKTNEFYETLFNQRSIKTENKQFDAFINTFTPLQMYWVCSLDRGWPSSMRGVRDASQDFVGILPLAPEWSRSMILELLEHQRKSDGWMPRQIGTVSRKAKHDMRYFCDGGAFLLELIHEYLTFTRDHSLLREKVWWLESDEKSTVLEHILSLVEFYITESAIGEHNLCKIYYGDWWDVMDKIGMQGRGESVTVTSQMILNLKNLSKMFEWLVSIGELDVSYLEVSEKYLFARKRFLDGMKKYAYNSLGYFNGFFNDDGKWLFSDKDPDGEQRLYLVSNAWGIISGATDAKMKQSILENIETYNHKGCRYFTSSKAFAVPVANAGRVGNGTTMASSYNHAQSFLVRAAAVAGNSELAYRVTRGIYPIEDVFAPCEQTLAPPFCIANSYSAREVTPNRVQLQYLSGTVSYVLRNCYSYFFGITYGYDGLELRTCLPKEFGKCSASFHYLGKKLIIKCIPSEQKRIVFNNTEWTKTVFCEEYEKEIPFFADNDMKDENTIEIYY